MTHEHEVEALRREYHRRIRWVKRLLRPLPRRATIHRYPGLGWFAKFARRRAYLWSFRTSAVIPALWAGNILAFLPLYGIQLALACGLALVLRANLPVLIGLQFLTNPVTVAPVYFVCFQFGHLFLKLLGVETFQLNIHELKAVLEAFMEGDWGSNARFFAQAFGITSLGGLIFGTFLGAVSSSIYKLAAMRASVTYVRIRELQRLREATNPINAPTRPPKLQRARRFFRKGRRWR